MMEKLLPMTIIIFTAAIACGEKKPGEQFAQPATTENSDQAALAEVKKVLGSGKYVAAFEKVKIGTKKDELEKIFSGLKMETENIAETTFICRFTPANSPAVELYGFPLNPGVYSGGAIKFKRNITKDFVAKNIVPLLEAKWGKAEKDAAAGTYKWKEVASLFNPELGPDLVDSELFVLNYIPLKQ